MIFAEQLPRGVDRMGAHGGVHGDPFLGCHDAAAGRKPGDGVLHIP
ncbi:Uncharacterised protein [Mycobacteroides abscessus subsp. abscessus]|nr:Uncharacterised protein [Mycobacteroides abscessus subsp. abscessus]